jgi:sulfur-oxidizing protein SoxY
MSDQYINRSQCSDPGRRAVLIGGGAATLLLSWFAGIDTVQAQTPVGSAAADKSNGFEEAVKKVLGDAKPTDTKMALELPEIAENGNTVPFTLSVDSPMSATDFVKAVHIISSGNPQAGVANFYFTPLSGKATVSSRMRLGRTQDVIAIAALSNGSFLMTKRTVKVTIGGCGG